MAYRIYQSKHNEAAQVAIGDALLDMLEERQASEITIKELCERAGVSRPTFYRHFDSIEDILGLYAQQVFQNTYHAIEPLMGKGNSGVSIVEHVFEKFLEHRRLFDLLRKRDLLSPLFGRLWILSSGSTQMQVIRAERSVAAMQDTFDVITYSWGGTFSVIFTWIIDGMERPAREMAQAVINAAAHVGSTFDSSYHDVSNIMGSVTSKLSANAEQGGQLSASAEQSGQPSSER